MALRISYLTACVHDLTGNGILVDTLRARRQATLNMLIDCPSEQLEFRSYWRFQLLAWGFLGGYMLLYLVATPRFWQWPLVATELARLAGFSIISHLIAKVAFSREWFARDRSPLLRRGLISCLVGSIALTSAIYPLASISYELTEDYEDFWPLLDFASNFGILAMWEGFFLAFYFHDLSRRSEVDRMCVIAASRDLQLSTLKTQLNPHFLFNSFNLLRALVQRDPEAARDSITHLSEMMRHSLSASHHNTISLASELDFVESYLALESLRYEERLRITADVPDELRHHKIPSMLLYTVVENAVKYGVDQSLTGVHVDYRIWRDGQHLCLCVANGGKLVEFGRSTGTGLANIASRLQLLYGSEAFIKVREHDDQVVAEARWPVSPQEGTP